MLNKIDETLADIYTFNNELIKFDATLTELDTWINGKAKVFIIRNFLCLSCVSYTFYILYIFFMIFILCLYLLYLQYSLYPLYPLYFLYPISCIQYPVSNVLYPVSCILYPVSCILYPVSCMLGGQKRCAVTFITFFHSWI